MISSFKSNKNFYGSISTGAANYFRNEKDIDSFLTKETLTFLQKRTRKEIKRLGLDRSFFKNKNIMNIGSGREIIPYIIYKPKIIDVFDISKINIKNLKNYLTKRKIKIIKSKKLDVTTDQLPKSKYDYVYLHGIAQHLSHVGKGLMNITNSLKKNSIMWFYFYRSGSFVNFLRAAQRHLAKKTSHQTYKNKLKKLKLNFKFIDASLDDIYVDFINFYSSDQYIKFLSYNYEIFGHSLLFPKIKKKVDFNNFHSSTILFLKKKIIKKLKVTQSY